MGGHTPQISEDEELFNIFKEPHQCKGIGCGTIIAARVKRLYCGKKCAPYGSWGDLGAGTKSDAGLRSASQMEKYIITTDSTPLVPSLSSVKEPRNGNESISDMSEGAGSDYRPNKSAATPKQSLPRGESPMSIDENSENGTPETKQNKVLRYASEDDYETLPLDSKSLSSNLSVERSESTSLIKDTMTHLRFLMKEVAKVPEAEKEHGLLPERVKAACDCAKNIRELMKTQLEAQKELGRK